MKEGRKEGRNNGRKEETGETREKEGTYIHSSSNWCVSAPSKRASKRCSRRFRVAWAWRASTSPKTTTDGILEGL
jgi:hypothetical protein